MALMNHQTAAPLFGGAAIEDGHEVIVFIWSNRFGRCYECGLPAAFTVADKATGTFEACEAEMRRSSNGERGCATPEAHTAKDEDLRCSVCAANAAANGESIWRLDYEENA